jgi:hypothetical protein
VVSTPPEPRQDRANERCGRSFSIEALIGGGELDFFDAQHPAPLGFVPAAIIERPLGILLAQVHVDRFGIASLDKRVQAHRMEPYSATRGRASQTNWRV